MAVTAIRLFSSITVAIVAASSAQAQEANCTSLTFGWIFNSLGQSPCHVAVQLATSCYPAGFNIPPLPDPRFSYFGPPSDSADSCRCNTVYYSLLSGCGACQGAQWSSWSVYRSNCTNVYVGTYPKSIPPSTSVPHWASLDVLASDSFNPSAAFADAQNTSASSTSTTPRVVSASATSNAPSSSPSAPNTGAIAGGVIGGFVFLALIAALLLLRQRRRGNKGSVSLWRRMASPDVLTTSTPPTGAWSTMSQPLVHDPKLYDLQDPTTLSSQQWSSGPLVTQRPAMTSSASLNKLASAMQYTGAPEIIH